MANPVQLVMTEGPWSGRTFSVDRQVLVLGRDPRSDIVIDHPQVSRRHARIARRGDTWVIEDLQSTNGTHVNGRQLSGPHTLAEGDTVGLGAIVTLIYREQGARVREAASATPADGPPAPDPLLPRDQARVQPGHSSRSAPSPTRRASSLQARPQGRPSQDWTWLWLGTGCAFLLLIVALAAVLVLDYFGWLPEILHEPLRWLGLP